MRLKIEAIAQRYAKALYSLASDRKELANVSAELGQLKTIFTDNPQLASALMGAELSPDQKKKLLAPLVEVASPLVRNFINMVFDYGRMNGLVDMINDFQKMYQKGQGIVTAKVTTAIELTDDQKKSLATQFARRIGANKVLINNHIDQDILGGVILEADGQIYDGSLSSKIESIKRLITTH